MVRLTVKELAKITGGKLITDDEASVVNGFSVDSRTLKEGDFFVAIKGENFDGYDFIKDAAGKGASGLLVDRNIENECREKVSHVLVVKDSLEAIGRIAGWIRSRVDIPAICITGTNGKTTVKEMLSRILSARYKVLKSRKSYNNIIGLSLTLFDLDPSYDIAVLELGSNHPGEIRKLAKIARPTIAIVTNIGDGHLEFFKSREGVFTEKVSLLDFLPEDGIAFLNKDDDFLGNCGKKEKGIKFFGTSEESDFRITDLKKKENGYSFSLNGKAFSIPLEGKHNVYNAAAAIAASGHFGIDEKELRGRLKELALLDMRLEKINTGGVTFINDSYNANPSSFECALQVLYQTPAGGKKGVIAGEMLELGKASRELHKRIGKSIADKKIDFLITVGTMAEHIANGAQESGMEKNNISRVKNHEDAAEILSRIAGAEDLVLLKGSRKCKMEEVIRCFTIFCIR